ncbi:MAG: isocitrate lyase/phosphoenolpyruvate mutase family protein [Verrucomicrobiota bacterium]|nr:isocitrate lyase/phosphoenolpyruvate mutase family protein [Verrucomicrobiota bacterium]
MNNTKSEQLNSIATFRELHEWGCFVLPNPWDAGTAVYLEHLGFKALATTSAGAAFSKGLPDSVCAIPRDLMLAHFREIVSATALPVNADFQNGYADAPEGVAENVKLCVATGVAGLSIEDSTGDEVAPLYEFDLAVDRIKAARAAIDASGIPVVLTGRCEAWLVDAPDPCHVAIERLSAYSEAGADCLYAPGVRDSNEIAAIVKAVAPKPVNVLVSRPGDGLSVSHLTDLGVRRISVGSALAAVAWSAFIRAAHNLATDNSFDGLADAASYSELNDLFVARNKE